jgi:hypothetical protein
VLVVQYSRGCGISKGCIMPHLCFRYGTEFLGKLRPQLPLGLPMGYGASGDSHAPLSRVLESGRRIEQAISSWGEQVLPASMGTVQRPESPKSTLPPLGLLPASGETDLVHQASCQFGRTTNVQTDPRAMELALKFVFLPESEIYELTSFAPSVYGCSSDSAWCLGRPKRTGMPPERGHGDPGLKR